MKRTYEDYYPEHFPNLLICRTYCRSICIRYYCYKKGTWSSYFVKNGKILKWKDMAKMMQPYDDAYKNLGYAKTNRIVAGALGFLGGFGIGWFVGNLIVHEPYPRDWAALGMGSFFICLSIPPAIKSPRQAKKAVLIYNRNITGL